MFRSWGTIGSPIFDEIEEGRGQNGTFWGDFTWNDPYVYTQRTDLNRPWAEDTARSCYGQIVIWCAIGVTSTFTTHATG